MTTLTTAMVAFYAAARSADERDALRASVSQGPQEAPAIEMRQAYPIWGRLGIGAEAWVELLDVEKRGIALRNNDRSGMSVSWRTFTTVLNALRHCGEHHYANPSEGPQEAPEPLEKPR